MINTDNGTQTHRAFARLLQLVGIMNNQPTLFSKCFQFRAFGW
jgi:hypothetical protein